MAFQPEFTITNEILTNVAEAQAAKEVIDNSPLIPQWERSFQNNALLRSAHHSTAIEGNQLDIFETERVMHGESIETGRVRDVKEIVNYRNAVGYLSVYSKKEITISFLFSIHKLLGKNVLSEKFSGKFREQEAVVINSQTGEVVFDASTPDDILSEIEDLIIWDRFSKEGLHPLLRAGILHFEFVRIHPFVDLNGRTARILATWSLFRDSFDIKRFFSLEEYYDQDIDRYYQALNSAHNDDFTTWLKYFTYGVAEELKRVEKQVLELSRDRKLKNKLGQIALNERQIQIIDFIVKNEKMSNPDFSTLFPDVSNDTILRDLRDLVTKEVVSKKGKTRGAYYILN